MSTQTRAVFEAALALPQSERAQLLQQLQDTLREADEASDDEWARGLNPRHAEIAGGTVPLTDLWDSE